MPAAFFFLGDDIMEINGYSTALLVILMLSSAYATLTIPSSTDFKLGDMGTETREDLMATQTTFERRRMYFGLVTALMLGGAIASWQGNKTWTMSLGGASLAGVLIYALGLHTVM